MSVLPGFRHVIRAIKFGKRIDALDQDGDAEGARALRREALETVPAAYCASLWRSEGWDRLRQGDAEGALEAFEKALQLLHGDTFTSASMFGVSRPDEVYYGAAWSALLAGNTELARGYYRRTLNFITDVDRRSSTPVERWPIADGLEELRCQLGEPKHE